LVLVPAPQSLVAEGIAELAPTVLLDGDGGSAVAAVVHDAGIGLDLEQALAVERALGPCRWAELNAALMLHEAGASDAKRVLTSSVGSCWPPRSRPTLSASCTSRPPART